MRSAPSSPASSISESEISYQAIAEIVPFRDLFAVLFFVSIGMLVDPLSLAEQPGALVVLVIVAVVVKGLMSAGLARLFGLPARSAVLLGATLAQVGEFSFILAEEALRLDILAQPAYDLLLGTARRLDRRHALRRARRRPRRRSARGARGS